MANVKTAAELDQIERDLVDYIMGIQHLNRIRKYVARRDSRKLARRREFLANLQRKRDDMRLAEIYLENRRMGVPASFPVACQD